MNRIFLGAVAALLFVSAGLFWWQGRAATERGAPPPLAQAAQTRTPDVLPSADVRGMHGPALPEATELNREQRRFGRLDRDRDGKISRNEMMATRTAAFRKLDVDGNNLLTFEEWAVATANRFKAADADGNLWLTPAEFATTAPKKSAKPKCGC